MRHEQGGWIVQNQDGSYEVWRVPEGTADSLKTIVGTKPPVNVVGWFHTHPNPMSEGFLATASPGDIAFTQYAGVPGVIVTHEGYKYIPLGQ